MQMNHAVKRKQSCSADKNSSQNISILANQRTAGNPKTSASVTIPGT